MWVLSLSMKTVLWLVLIGMAIVHAMHGNDLQDEARMDLEENQAIRRNLIGKRGVNIAVTMDKRVFRERNPRLRDRATVDWSKLTPQSG